MMSKLTIILLIGWAITTPLRGGTTTDGQKKSENFTYKYECDVLPTNATPAFIMHPLNNRTTEADYASTDGEILTINTNTDGAGTANDIFGYQLAGGPGTAWDVTAIGPFTVEIRTKIMPNNSASYGAILKMQDINSSGIFQMFFNKLVMGATTVSTALNNDEFHVIRIASFAPTGSSAGQVYRVWRDKELLGDSGQFSVYQTINLSFGDILSGSAEVNFQIDYLRWDFTGAYEPVPDPIGTVIVIQ